MEEGKTMVVTAKTANTYYQAALAKEKENPNDAKNLYGIAVREYNVLTESAQTEIDKEFYARRIDDCLDRIGCLTPKPKRMSIGEEEDRNPAADYKIEIPKETFDDVAGMKELKSELERALIRPIIYQEVYKKFAKKKANKGVLLYGPPGCGKTYVMKALAGEASKRFGKPVTFIHLKVSDLLSKWVGENEKTLRAYFKLAAEHEPSILFFDEIDGIVGTRNDGASDYSNRLINEYLADFDEIKDKLVLVAGTTNAPWRIDPAATRPGRLGKKILVKQPDLEARVELFKIHTRGMPIAKDVDYKELANLTKSYSAADIEELCSEASDKGIDNYIEKGAEQITKQDFLDALKVVKPSLYNWATEAKKQIEEGKVSKEYRDGLLKVIEELEGEK
jgi:transitional endoplasmic reticulum ATPase